MTTERQPHGCEQWCFCKSPSESHSKLWLSPPPAVVLYLQNGLTIPPDGRGVGWGSVRQLERDNGEGGTEGEKIGEHLQQMGLYVTTIKGVFH